MWTVVTDAQSWKKEELKNWQPVEFILKGQWGEMWHLYFPENVPISEHSLCPLILNMNEKKLWKGEDVGVSMDGSHWMVQRKCMHIWGGSWVQSASCYQKVAGSVPLACSAYQRSWILNPKTAPNVLVGTLHGSHCQQCMNYCKSLSAKCKKQVFISVA